MVRTLDVGVDGRRGGLTGYRYLLAVTMLVALTTVPMLVAMVAGAATLSGPPAPPEVDATPFVTYPYSGAASPAWAGCPGWPNQLQ